MIYEVKKILLFSFLTLAISACTEIAPVVPTLGDRKVLVEEFTGVRCVNCPAGASELDNLRGIYGDRLVVVSIHTGDFSTPYSDSKFDFRTPEGTALEKNLGAPLGYPTAERYRAARRARPLPLSARHAPPHLDRSGPRENQVSGSSGAHLLARSGRSCEVRHRHQ